MVNVVVKKERTSEEILMDMREKAEYDVADNDDMANGKFFETADIKAKKNPPKVPKIYVAGRCINNCAYCGCRCGRTGDKQGDDYDAWEPRELAELAVNSAKNNGNGIFISSAIYKSPNYTQELMARTVRLMRTEFNYQGYIHAKVMPGADPALIKETGSWANRLSINIEVAKNEGYERIARDKNKDLILKPMAKIHEFTEEYKGVKLPNGRYFAASGHTTQLMPGSVGEDDRTIINLADALYKKFDLKRVYYSPFTYKHQAEGYDLPLTKTPGWRGGRLYQADFLMKYYNFKLDDILPAGSPNLDSDIDPKISFALRNIHLYPVEINTAPYETLILIPGIGTTYAQKIIEVRKYLKITHNVMKKMGISLKRAVYFITCEGKYMGGGALDIDKKFLRSKLVSYKENKAENIMKNDQLTLDALEGDANG